MKQSEIRLLGEFRLWYGEDELTADFSPRLRALLTFFLLQREAPILRRRVAFHFWPDVPEAKARNNLRQLLYRLRMTFPDTEHFLRIQTATVQWRSDAPATVDLIDFEVDLNAATTIPELESALALYGGPLLAGHYDEWLLRERERLHQNYVAGCEQLATMLEQKGEYEAAAQQLRKLISLEPIRESAYMRLMRIYARMHDTAALEHVYQDCATLLQRDLGVEPSPALQKKYEKLARVAAGKQRRVHLPVQPTPLIGRQSELLAISERLQDTRCRLLTLVGPGGIGKTRLALEAARAAAVDFIDGTVFLPLARLTSAGQLLSTLASTLNLRFAKELPTRRQLVEQLSDKELLLVLDNYEHLLPDTALIESILAGAPNVKCLATSRARLRLRWEWLLDVKGLSRPESSDDQAQDGGAVRLLRYHLQRLGVHIAQENGEHKELVRIARLTGGMPLALELAAAAARDASLTRLARRLEESIDALELAHRDTDPRHWSMRATFDHSWNLLAPREQNVLARLAVFHGAFDAPAAHAVAGVSEATLRRLVEKSLLQRRHEARFVWHELLRQYAEEKLRIIPSAWRQALADHCSHYVAAVKEAKGQDSANHKLVALMVSEIDNIRQAWQTAASTLDHEALDQFVVGLAIYHQIHTLNEECARMCRQGVSALRQVADRQGELSPDRQRVLGHLLAWLGWAESGPATRFEVGEEAVNLLRPFDAPLELGTALMVRGNALRLLDRPGEALPDLQEAVELFMHIEETFHLSGVLNVLGLAHEDLGESAAAQRCFEQVLKMARDLGIDYVAAVALGNLASIARQRGDYEEAEAWLIERLELSRRMDDELILANTLQRTGVVAYEQGRLREAKHHLLKAKETTHLRRRAPETWQYVVSGLARAALEQGKRDEARQYLIDGLQNWRNLRFRWRATDFFLALADWFRDERPVSAAELLSVAATTGPHAVRREARRDLERLQEELPPDALEEAMARSEASDLDEMVELLLSELRPS